MTSIACSDTVNYGSQPLGAARKPELEPSLPRSRYLIVAADHGTDLHLAQEVFALDYEILN